ncbi:bone morphogenetic protein 2-like [Polyodon spathula]|uniref:bone morphogenetic protein 2-like n=1 Tax=Polyodon spathula TaxID=7913 RepID=UPI001B7DD965|nr:bone morphogenetic protein 2-like [Polyodon spathula]
MGLGSTVLYIHSGILLFLYGPFLGAMGDEMNGYGDEQLSKAILEMLHINKLTVPHRTRPHPYMKLVYQFLDSPATRDLTNLEGTLVQSFRSIQDPKYGTPGWIWFNVSCLKPSMKIAELVLLRKTLHPEPLTVNVAVHSIFVVGNSTVSEPLDEKALTLDELPSSGYDIFNVSAVLGQRVADMVGFQFRYTDESGSLVLHEALTQSLYCLNTSSQNEPLLVVYQFHQHDPSGTPRTPDGRQQQHCRITRSRRQLLQEPAYQETSSLECRLLQHYVNFHSIRLDRWILEPPGFNASFCKGFCYPTKPVASQDAEQGIRRTAGSVNWTANVPLCTPQGLKPVSVMYVSESEDIIIENLKDMRAENCVCMLQPLQ